MQLFASMKNPIRAIKKSQQQQANHRNQAQHQQMHKNMQASLSTNNSCKSLTCSLGNNKLKQLDEYDIFKCHKCQVSNNPNCQVCGGLIELSGKSNLVKFMQYIFEFKLGFKDSYISEKMKNQSQNKPNAWCTDVIANSNMRSKNIEHLRYSEGAFNPRLYQSSMINKCQQAADIHNGYQCDVCRCQPIKGNRYHCKTCQDFDLCQKCFNSQGHEHEMKKIQSSLLYSSISGILQKLKKQQKIVDLKNTKKIDSDLLKPIGIPSIFRSSIR